MKYREIEETINPSDVNLSSFKLKGELNPKFWQNGRINQKYRRKLLSIAKDFLQDIDIGWVNPKDVIVTGSIANYNWNEEYSDIDLHIVLDYDDVDDKTSFVEKYFKYAKNEWNGSHSKIRIGGFPVEVYVQDIDENHKSEGVYSILNDKWLKKPSKDLMYSGNFDKETVSEEAAGFMNEIDDLENKLMELESSPIPIIDKSDDAANIYALATEIFGRIKNCRKESNYTGAFEMTTGNLTFKTLRRTGYVEKIILIKRSAYDIMMSA